VHRILWRCVGISLVGCSGGALDPAEDFFDRFLDASIEAARPETTTPSASDASTGDASAGDASAEDSSAADASDAESGDDADESATDARAEALDASRSCSPGEREQRWCGRCGTSLRTCGAEGLWSEWSPCQGEKACAAGDVEREACPIGGTRARTCSEACVWGAFGACAECSAADFEERTCGNCGFQQRRCAEGGKWGAWGACAGEGCTPSATETASCGLGGTRTRRCTEQCRWSPFSTCAGSRPADGELWVAKSTRRRDFTVGLAIERLSSIDGSETAPRMGIPDLFHVTTRPPLTISSNSLHQGQLSRSTEGFVHLGGYRSERDTGLEFAGEQGRTFVRIRPDEVDSYTALLGASRAPIYGVVSVTWPEVYLYGWGGIEHASHARGVSPTKIFGSEVTGLAVFDRRLFAVLRESSVLTVRAFRATTPPTAQAGEIVLREPTGEQSTSHAIAVLGPPGGEPDTILVGAWNDQRARPGLPTPPPPGVQVWTRSGTAWTRLRILTAELRTDERPAHLAAARRADGTIAAYVAASSAITSRIVAYEDVRGPSPSARVLRIASSTEAFHGITFAGTRQ
jgi:hypothetical protein